MKRTILGLLFAVVIAVAALISDSSVASANHNRFIPGTPTTVQLRVLARGYGIYCLNANAVAYPGFRAQMQTVFADEQARVGIRWQESTTGKDCDVQHLMVKDSSFPCGAGASACIYYSDDPVIVYYDQDLLYSDWKTTIGHEHGHWDGSHERYFDNGIFQCDPTATYTRNSCGTGVWWVTDYDLGVAWNTMVPDAPMTVSFSVAANGWATIKWDKYRADCTGLPAAILNGTWTNIPDKGPAHPSCKNDVATRMAFGHSACDGCAIEWVGNICGAAFEYCYSNFTDYARSFDSFWRGCLYVHAENTALWWVPQVSAPNFWSKAGCF